MIEMKQAKWMTWTGRVLSALVGAGLAMSAYMKLSGAEEVVQGLGEAGYPAASLLYIGIAELACVVLYWIPQTAVLGAILATGYLGGAVSTHVRAGEGFLAPVLFGVVIWVALWLRDSRVRALTPIRSLEAR